MGLSPLRQAEAPVADLGEPPSPDSCHPHHAGLPASLLSSSPPLAWYACASLELPLALLVTLLEGLFTIAVTLRHQLFLNLLSNPVEGNVTDPEWIRQKVVHLGIKQWNNCVVALLHPDSTSAKDV
ncbi:hypothetical protein DSO57_1014941 [Entomophthora muscae]|uniref:Uncharacterized protein n=1 Tax=Entomophthora muscae TaxID=34485 RepID=A0ACC2SU87_9FUNG|nr:hypothetical protein DSO57_1014941 [Entomophthora muscae]